MKIRTCYVSNSSSSSYICEVCGEVREAYDQGPEDVGMCECVVGHVFCEGHALEGDPITAGELRKAFENHWSLSRGEQEIVNHYPDALMFYRTVLQMPDSQVIENSPLFQYNTDAEALIKDAFDGKMRESCCPICMFHVLSEHEGFDFLKKLHGLTDAAILDEIRQKFKNHWEFRRYIYGRD